MTRARGDIPGLLRRCSPILIAGRRGIVDWVGTRPHWPGLWVRYYEDNAGGEPGGHEWGADPMPEPRPVDVIRLSALSLDLSDRTGMNHGVEWLAERLGKKAGPTAPRWEIDRQAEYGTVWILVCPVMEQPEHISCGAHEDSGPNFWTCRMPRPTLDPASALALAIEHVAGVNGRRVGIVRKMSHQWCASRGGAVAPEPFALLQQAADWCATLALETASAALRGDK